MNNQAIGIVDSGFGCIAAVKEFNTVLPHENIICLCDIMDAPYDKLNREEISDIITRNSLFLAKKDVKLIINTCDYTGLSPQKSFVDEIPCVGLHLPAAQAACSSTRNGKIGIIGSPAAIQSAPIGKAVKTIRPGTSVIGSSSDLIIPAVLGDYNHKKPELLKEILLSAIKPLLDDEVDTIILGSIYCEFILDAINDIVSNSITLISPLKEAVKAAELLMFERDLLSDSTEAPYSSFLINGNEEFFKEYAAKLCGGKINGNVSACKVG